KYIFVLLFFSNMLQKWTWPGQTRSGKRWLENLYRLSWPESPRCASFLGQADLHFVYKRHGSFYFCCAIESQDNEIITLEMIHQYVDVCELDIIYDFEKVYYFMLDDSLMGGKTQDIAQKSVLLKITEDSKGFCLHVSNVLIFMILKIKTDKS
uniref:AP complex mu/sigma subunit domain-containing protein n=1 Tax=Sarcophilus harrisii TaxID=9305 RepID=A0A7N4PA50_SARHA